MTIAELLQRKGELATQAQQVLDDASKDGRMTLRSEESDKFDKIHVDIEEITRMVDRLEKQAALETSERRTEHTQPGQKSTDQRTERGMPKNADRAEALRAWFMAGRADQPLTQPQIEAAKRVGVNLGSKSLTISLAPVALRAENLRRPSAEEIRAWHERALEVGVSSPDTGSYKTVPDEAMRALEVAMLAFGGMRQVATVLRTATGADLPIPTMNDTSNKGAILAESVQTTETDPSFDSLILESYKYTSKKILVSIEFLQDSAINASEVIGRMLGERIARITNDHFTTGTGNSQPNGVITAATSSSVTTASATAIAYDELIDLEHSVDPAYRDNGRFMFADGTLKLLKKIKIPQFSGDTAGMPLWRPGLAAGVPDTIDNFPYVINQSVATGASSKAIAFGDFSKYQIRDVREITLLRLDELYAEYGQVAFLAFSRHDGDLLDAGTHPVKYLTMHS